MPAPPAWMASPPRLSGMPPRGARPMPVTGPHSAYFGQETNGTYNLVRAATSGTLTSGAINLQSLRDAQLSFSYFLKTEPLSNGEPVSMSTTCYRSWSPLTAATICR